MDPARWIMHVDMDAFFASVEVLDDPHLKGKPVIVGGQSERGVVATCSYEARKRRVHSAMPMTRARLLCPEAVFLKGRMERYEEVSNEIMKIFRDTAPLVEQLSIDEAFLDLTGVEHIYGGPEKTGRLVKERIKREIGLTASVGLAPNKFLAKLASDLEKPDGLTIIRHGTERDFIAPLPVNKIFGIGKAAKEQLGDYGIVTIGQLAALDVEVIRQVFGKNAERVKLLAQGIDDRPLVPESAPKSVGREVTFLKDLYGFEACKRALLDLSGMTGYRLRKKGFFGHTLTLKVRFSDFKTITRSMTGEGDISCDEEIFELACRLLKGVNIENRGIRLLGVTVSSLHEGKGTALFEEDERKIRRTEAIDSLKARFGENIIRRGRVED
ncbi:MAG: DNA polymerase IV [Phascolarctobacterium sp.]|nr:DNA polymerase IV [Phascolarctobacterium sp.]